LAIRLSGPGSGGAQGFTDINDIFSHSQIFLEVAGVGQFSTIFSAGGVAVPVAEEDQAALREVTSGLLSA